MAYVGVAAFLRAKTIVQVASFDWIWVGLTGNAPGSGNISSDNPEVTTCFS